MILLSFVLEVGTVLALTLLSLLACRRASSLAAENAWLRRRLEKGAGHITEGDEARRQVAAHLRAKAVEEASRGYISASASYLEAADRVVAEIA